MSKIEQRPADQAKEALKIYEDSVTYYFPEPVLVQGGREQPEAIVPYYNAA
ncbi:hypothetical protein [Actibacterium ureilyticum]|uniref:hypothetical protein n=1 Tax=Actibacterium ureilyticum TaxID=1590614 RepID=UPI001595C231|nr:hypothetical protein [Actibacterium ureilyticum]